MEREHLHFIRLRKKDSTEPFCDPMADIKQVVQQAFKELPVLYRELFKDEEKADYLKAYLKVFTTRLEEDKTLLLQQLMEFAGAMHSKFSDKELQFFEQMLGKYILYTFALYQRRDGAVDAKERGAIRAASALLTVHEELSQETMNKVLEELPKVKEHFEHFDETIQGVDALCIEDANKTVKDIKALVAWHFNPGADWKTTAKLCDTYVQQAEGNSEKDIAAALAYPDYESPYFEMETENDVSNTGSKTPEV